jgi:predicted nucleotidyltransferase
VSSDQDFGGILDAMRHAAGTLRDSGIDFALAGGLAIYARGGPETDHDVDFVLARADAERALELLGAAGWRQERPPEGWLFKVFDSRDATIDLIFAPNNRPEAVPEILQRADQMEIYAITLKVLSVTDVLASKLLALKEHEVDYESVLAIARACREQIDWELLRSQTAGHPYATAFFTLARELGLSPQTT